MAVVHACLTGSDDMRSRWRGRQPVKTDINRDVFRLGGMTSWARPTPPDLAPELAASWLRRCAIRDLSNLLPPCGNTESRQANL